MVVFSDHEEEFEEHGRLYHGKSLYEEVLRVALILAGPGVPAGRRVETPVALQDLFATLLDAFGLEAPEPRDSRSLWPLVRGGRAPARPVHPCCTAHDAQKIGIRRAERKHILNLAGEPPAAVASEELYDLVRDPGERRNLIGTEETAGALRRLAVSRSRRNQERVEARRERPADPAYREQLRALGYVP